MDLIYSTATINHGKAFYVIGGHQKKLYDTTYTVSDKIMYYNATYDKWVFVGKLMNGRYDHSAIVINKKIFIIGGQSDFPAEECGLTVPSFCSSVNKIEVTVKKPKLFGFSLSDCNIYTEIQIYEEKNNTNSILVLTQNDDKIIGPSVIDLESYFNPQITSTLFKGDKKSEKIKVSIMESCSIIHKNKLFVYGGKLNSVVSKQILELDCKTKKLEERTKLSFDFVQGSCASNNVVIVLCFAKLDRKLCYKSIVPDPRNWWESFTQIFEKSKYAHADGAFAMSEG